MITFLIIGLVLVLLAAYAITVFNGLVKLRNRADEGFSDIDVQLKRRHDLIPNLIETVKGYAEHERGVLERVTESRNKAINADDAASKAQAESGLNSAMLDLFAVAENYPDLKASTNFLELQNDLEDTENKIQAARRHYNMTVRDLNIKIEQFPSSVIASAKKFQPYEFFELENPAERAVPQVSFN